MFPSNKFKKLYPSFDIKGCSKIHVSTNNYSDARDASIQHLKSLREAFLQGNHDDYLQVLYKGGILQHNLEYLNGLGIHLENPYLTYKEVACSFMYMWDLIFKRETVPTKGNVLNPLTGNAYIPLGEGDGFLYSFRVVHDEGFPEDLPHVRVRVTVPVSDKDLGKERERAEDLRELVEVHTKDYEDEVEQVITEMEAELERVRELELE